MFESKRLMLSLVAGAQLAAASAAFAIGGNLQFLRDSPAAFFDKADIALYKQTGLAALNEGHDGETRTWSNAKTGSSGTFKVVRTLPGTEKKCRELEITNRAAGRSHTERAVFCYDADKDRWAMRRPGT